MSRIIQVYDEEKQINTEVRRIDHSTDVLSLSTEALTNVRLRPNEDADTVLTCMLHVFRDPTPKTSSIYLGARKRRSPISPRFLILWPLVSHFLQSWWPKHWFGLTSQLCWGQPFFPSAIICRGNDINLGDFVALSFPVCKLSRITVQHLPVLVFNLGSGCLEMPRGATVGGASRISLVHRWVRASLPPRALTNSKSVSSFLLFPASPHSHLPPARRSCNAPCPAPSLFSPPPLPTSPLLAGGVGDGHIRRGGEAILRREAAGDVPRAEIPRDARSGRPVFGKQGEGRRHGGLGRWLCTAQAQAVKNGGENCPHQVTASLQLKLKATWQDCLPRVTWALSQQSKWRGVLRQLAWFISSSLWKESPTTTETSAFFLFFSFFLETPQK